MNGGFEIRFQHRSSPSVWIHRSSQKPDVDRMYWKKDIRGAFDSLDKFDSQPYMEYMFQTLDNTPFLATE
jgi:hypothetical protein